MGFFKRLSSGVLRNAAGAPRGKEGMRAYAVGDIHGRLDLLNELLAKIEADSASRPPLPTLLIFLGDLIDRGEDSAGVVERLRTYEPPGIRLIFLAGNHEEVLLHVLAGDRDLLSRWLKFGGTECATSYGVDVPQLKRTDGGGAIEVLRRAVPAAHVEFLESFADTFRFGDYLFVHAGIRPGLALEDQDRNDLRWIREPFLTDTKEHGVLVVHGHTIVDEVEERPNRIGIDTGAYRSGVLTALAIEGDRRWYLATGASAKDV